MNKREQDLRPDIIRRYHCITDISATESIVGLKINMPTEKPQYETVYLAAASVNNTLHHLNRCLMAEHMLVLSLLIGRDAPIKFYLILI